MDMNKLAKYLETGIVDAMDEGTHIGGCNISEIASATSEDDGTNDGPKNETLAEHRKHCEAEPGNCPFEKKLDKTDSDVIHVSSGNKADVKKWLEEFKDARRENHEAAENLYEVVSGLPAEQHEELANLESEIDRSWGEEIDFETEHSRYLPYSNKKIWDSEENHHKGKDLEKKALAAEKKYYDRLHECIEGAGWKFDRESWSYKKDAAPDQNQNTQEDPKINEEQMPSMMHGSSMAAANALQNFMNRQNAPAETTSAPTDYSKLADSYKRSLERTQKRIDDAIKAGRKPKKADLEDVKIFQRGYDRYMKKANAQANVPVQDAEDSAVKYLRLVSDQNS